MKTNLWKKILPFVGLLSLAIVIYRIGTTNILYVIKNAKIEYLLILPGVVIFVFIVQAAKWHVILTYQAIAVEFKHLLKLTLVGIFYGSITPGRIGGFIKIKYLSDYCNKSVAECISSVVTDKTMDLISLGLFASIGSIILAKRPGISMIPIIFIVILISASLIIYDKERMEKLITMVLLPYIPQKLRSNLKKNFRLFYYNMPEKKKLLLPLILSITTWLLIFTQVFIIARALSIEIHYHVFIFIISIGTLIALIPITLNGIGTKDVTLIMIFSIYGVSAEKTLGMSLLSLLLCVYIPALIGGLLSLGLKKKQRKI